MAEKDAISRSEDTEYEIVEGESDRLAGRTAPWISPTTLKLRHRIGRGPFGDVWLATHHQSTDDYDEHHEVALKMLYPMKEDQRRIVLDKFEDLFSKCQGVENASQLEGVSIVNGKISIIMKFYEGSVGDRMASLKGGKLSLPDVLRYAIDVAQGILELHSKGILILNLKPSNFLLKENDRAVLGDVGIPYLLLGIPLPSLDMAARSGTPNYMAPEQWQADIRGPISHETDSWGFACSIVEMLTGVQPWSGRSIDEIYDLVVGKQEKPPIPSGIPPSVENLLRGCFMYDLRSRPSMTDIVHVLQSSQSMVNSEEGWSGLERRALRENSKSLGYTEWFLSKDHLRVGDTVRSRKPAYSCKPENMDVPLGTVVGLEHDTDPDGFALVKVHGIHNPLRAHVSTLERVTNGLAAGDWVRLKEDVKGHSPVGILHSNDRDGNVSVGFIGLPTLWKGNSSQLQMAEPYSAGQFVKLKPNVLSPRFKWPRKTGGTWATGRICQVLPNGCLVVKFPGRLTFQEENIDFMADPAEIEVVTFSTCPGVMKKYQHLEDFHWAVRPLVIAFGLFTAMKVGFLFGKGIGKLKSKKQRTQSAQGEGQQSEGQGSSSSSGWLRPSVTHILFKEGVNGASTR